jgi:hypothetical protein
MRDQKNRIRQEHFNENIDPETIESAYPSWDMEELDLTARYKKVEIYFSDNEMNQPRQILNSNHFKYNRNE